jgi:hypothetical protein
MMDFDGTKDDRARERRSRAIEASSAVARSLGIDCSCPTILKDSNNTIVHLAPSPVVAKVATTMIRPNGLTLLQSELSIGLYLASRNAPIARPASSVAPGPHGHGEMVLTLWDFRDHNPERSVEPAQLAMALKGFHEAFAGYPGELPEFTGQVEEAGKVLSNPSRTPTLPQDDREFLQAVQLRMLNSLQTLDFPVQPLHGDPHLDGNILRTADGPVFIDFEASCTGPKEWDLSSLGGEVASFYSTVDFALLEILSLTRSLCVTALCWMQPERAPEVEEAAYFHLSRLRTALGPLSPGGDWGDQ